MKKAVPVILAAALIAVGMAGCKGSTSTSSSSSASTGSKSVIVISKSYGAQFYQASFKGAKDAAAKYGLSVTFEGPDVESNVSQQVDQVNAAINKKPAAIVLAACDPTALTQQMTKAKSANIPVIGFDSGVPGDTSGAVVATAATDNKKAGAMVADNLFQSDAFQKAIAAGTTSKPAVIGILSQDAISGSIVQRTTGFVDELVAKLNTVSGLANAVQVTGQSTWNKTSSSPAKVTIQIAVPPTTSAADVQTAATTILNTKNLVALFGSNQTAVDGIISATADGSQLDKTSGRYKDLLAVGFDAGKGQKAAVKAKEFLGSVTQDPYTMGYDAVQIASEIIKGSSVSDVDTGSKWYNSDNISDSSIAQLLYD